MSTVELSRIAAGSFTCGTVQVEIPKELKIQEEPDAPANCGMFRILTAKDGDKRVVWNRLVMQEIQAAKKMFMNLIDKGLVPHRVKNDGTPSAEIMKEFDPRAEEVIFLPIQAVRGG